MVIKLIESGIRPLSLIIKHTLC